MTIINSARPDRVTPADVARGDSAHRDRVGLNGPAAVFAAAAAIGTAGWVYVSRVLPIDAMLPAMTALLLVLAAIAAAIALTRPQTRARRFTYWDAAGALVLVGAFAAAAVEPDQMVRLFEGNRQP